MRAIMMIVLVLWATSGFAGDAKTPAVDVLPQPDGAVIVVISPEAAKACAEQGGCTFISGTELEAYIQSMKPQLCGSGSI